MIFGVDIDDTLFVSERIEGEYVLKYADIAMIDRVNALHEEGHTIILWTGRHWNHLNVTKQQLDKYGVKYDSLVMAKPPVDVMVDDKAVTPEQFLAGKL